MKKGKPTSVIEIDMAHSTISVSAPGKLMLLGEHAVVYGQPCIVTAVDKRLTVSARRTSGSQIKIDAPQVKETRFVDRAVGAFFLKYKVTSKNQGLSLSVHSDFTHQVGFGSSSAVSVATLKALSILYDIPVTQKDIFNLAYQVTIDIQGVGSGFDIAAATYGGTVYFRKGGSEISQLNTQLPIVVGYTGTKADTPILVRQVQEKYLKAKRRFNQIFKKIGSLVNQGKNALENKDWQTLGRLMDQNQDYLRQLGVSSPKLNSLISAAKAAGAWGAKLSGAGGGDCMIALVSQVNRQAVERALKVAGGEIITVNTHATGVRVEFSADLFKSKSSHTFALAA